MKYILCFFYVMLRSHYLSEDYIRITLSPTIPSLIRYIGCPQEEEKKKLFHSKKIKSFSNSFLYTPN